MIKFENTEVYGWEAAIRGMRMPMQSWAKSDSGFGCDYSDQHFCSVCEDGHTEACPNCFKQYKLGPNDLDLMMRLRNAGTDHRKFMRMITVTVDITAPMYWWKEFDTYKVATVRNSTSTMHKIHAKEFTLEDFSCEHLLNDGYGNLLATIDLLNKTRDIYLHGGEIITTGIDVIEVEPKDKRVWWQLIQLLPSSYNQKATMLLNYEVLANMYRSRRGHKLDEWSVGFVNWVKDLPYSEIITGSDISKIPICHEIMNEAERRITKEMIIEAMAEHVYAPMVNQVLDKECPIKEDENDKGE